MAEKQLLEKENISSANSKISSGGNTLNDIQYSAVSSSLPPPDIFLEDTLVNIKPAKPLTKREAEILQLIVQGKTNKKIAQVLYRTERTVEYHRNRLMRKLGAKTAADLVKRAITMGIIS